MAKASVDIISALRQTAKNLKQSKQYQWGHMGSCNCGFLAQQVSQLSKDEIHRRAMERYGDWNEQLNDYCSTSGLPIDDLISEMIQFGFDADDLKHLERLSDPKILRLIPFEERNLKHNLKADVVRYLEVWADHLEAELVNAVNISDLSIPALAEREV